MKFLVSICNKQKARGLEDPDHFLYEIDLREDAFPTPVSLNHNRIVAPGGITGLARYKGGYAAVTQSELPQIIHFDSDYRVLEVWDLRDVVDAHSVMVWNDKFYVVASGSDSILELDPDTGEVKTFWRDNEKNKDSIHMNSLVLHAGDLYLTAFGKKRTKHWRSADQGYLYNITRAECTLTPIYHPHTAVSLNGGIILCESFRSGVMDEQGGYFNTGRGYIRGLAYTEDLLLLGSSTGRNYSRSTGLPVDDSDDPDLSGAACEVLVYGWEKGRLDSCTFLRSISFDKIALEIYDILQIC